MQVAQEIALTKSVPNKALPFINLSTTELEYPWTHQFKLHKECGKNVRRTVEGFEEAVVSHQLGIVLDILHEHLHIYVYIYI